VPRLSISSSVMSAEHLMRLGMIHKPYLSHWSVVAVYPAGLDCRLSCHRRHQRLVSWTLKPHVSVVAGCWLVSDEDIKIGH